MKLALQKLTVGIVLRVVHAALVELYGLDSRVRAEFDRMPEGMSYALQTGHAAPELYVQWTGGRLLNLKKIEKPTCALRLKSTGISFRMFTGQMGLAQAYAQHAFSMQGEIADVMRLARLVNLVEGYLFPKFITKHILTDIPALQVNPLRVYGRVLCGFLTGRYN
ncbi:MAG: hypothetical protein IJX33_05385 [Akkermansia sp.]|nr:hypothetical protein [Akkermansia sp.]MBQ8376466.1 hypothetical protein [Akkermansia sp.]